MADIFLSYASEDRERVEPVARALLDEVWSVWWDRDLIAGPSFHVEIERTKLAQLSALKVISRTSVMRFKERSRPLRERNYASGVRCRQPEDCAR